MSMQRRRLYSVKEDQCVGLYKSVCIHGKCIEGAVCNFNGECVCDSNHFDSPDKTCELKKQIFVNCTRDVECMRKDKLNLRCISRTCNCPVGLKYSKVQKYEYSVNNYNDDSESYEWIREPLGFRGAFLELCAPLINSSCTDGYCVESAKCEITDSPRPHDIYRSAICTCLGDLSPNGDLSLCAASYDKNCNYDSECNDDLVCSSEKCRCIFPMHQYFDFSTKTCVTYVGGSCTKASTCIENSYCLLSSANSTTGHCQCNEGFVMNQARSCDGSYGTDCSMKSPPCDSVAGLICRNQKCSCPDAMYTYSAQFRKCLGVVGANCDPSDESKACVKNPEKCDMGSSPNLACVLSAQCYKQHPMLPAQCKCMESYAETENHTCLYVPNENQAEIHLMGEGF